MKLIRFGNPGEEKPGLMLDDGRMKDCSAWYSDWNGAFFESGGIAALSGRTSKFNSLPDVPAGVRVGAPVARPWKVICVGLNYSDHAAESGMPVPAEPILFSKTSNTVVGPHDDVKIPRDSVKTDWEVELGIVIGRTAHDLQSPQEAQACVAGYCVSHDVSERSFQLEHGGQWVKGKSCDTFNPLGPWLVTPDEIDELGDLGLWLEVNGERMQTGNTSFMIFDPLFIVQYISRFITLEPGDLINTGTPPGVGMGRGVFLKSGDVVELGIDGLGTQKQTFR